MTKDEITSIESRLKSGWDMVMQQAEKIGKEKKEWSLCDVGMMSDILKDCSKVFKNLAQVDSMSNVEKY